MEAFLEGEMPAEVHPVVRNKYPLREGLMTDGLDETILTQSQERAAEVLERGLVKPTQTQTKAVLTIAARDGHLDAENIPKVMDKLRRAGATFEKIDGTESDWHGITQGILRQLENGSLIATGSGEVIKQALEAKVLQSATSWDVILDDNIINRAERPWKQEPHAPDFGGGKLQYQRALAASHAGQSPIPDAAEAIRQQLFAGKLNVDTAHAQVSMLVEEEWLGIQRSVIRYMEDNPDKAAVATDYAMRAAADEPGSATLKPVYARHAAESLL